ncbi:uncharacterized protein T551_03179 [Pneumocystis jirovecii RU7]|uniref:DUF1772 domain-containing protein n=1 Tax=Pneumocystis jirovecii (strain RU7) TaxID=1408657 RepID=A0A0W4ZFL5_PNEJ7|nr:uncharacterized protein T551_03179 [Pneumocystis jirovecii RU7]KTW27185.1 hypothetical protein T551_03179 [Pneumocystis jirovecii RU7]
MDNKRVIVAVSCKIIGTVTIGCIAGSYLSLSAFMIPAITSACSLSSIFSMINVIVRRWIRYIWPLESLASVLFLGAYILSEPQVSHPYLLYSSFGIVSLIPATFFYIQPRITKIIQQIQEKESLTLSERTLKNWNRFYIANTVWACIIFAMTVVGSYGDTLSA